jgi:hypothetical protein
MSKKSIVKKIKYMLRFISDKRYVKIYYRLKMHKKLNLKEPKTYSEKLNWLKLNDHNPLYTKLVDKYEVKDYIKNEIGEEYVIPTYGIYNNVDEIDLDKLPNQFVLKCTHDSEGIVICKDKSKLDWKAAKKKLKQCLKYNFYYIGREWPYKNVKPRIICEQYIEDNDKKELWDYKFLCFNGEPKVMFIVSDRQTGHTKLDFFDMNFNRLEIKQDYPNSNRDFKKPICFDKMIELSKILSKKFKYIRLDFYEVNGKVYFGEFTFYHHGGFTKFEPEEYDEILGSYINL